MGGLNNFEHNRMQVFVVDIMSCYLDKYLFTVCLSTNTKNKYLDSLTCFCLVLLQSSITTILLSHTVLLYHSFLYNCIHCHLHWVQTLRTVQYILGSYTVRHVASLRLVGNRQDAFQVTKATEKHTHTHTHTHTRIM